MTTDVMTWLREVRRLDSALLSAMKVRAVDHPQLGNAAAFPYIRGDEQYAAKFRTIDKRFSSSRGVSRGLYNEDDLRRLEALPVLITEGEIDALSVMQAGFERAVSVPDGWTADAGKAEALVEASELLRNSPFVIVAGDGDSTGESLPRTVAQILEGHDVRAVTWPAGCKDANDVLVRHGEGALAACLNAAKRVDPPGGLITGFSDLPPLADRRVLRIGEYPFNYVVALEIGALSVWTGTPGSGKSTFLRWAAERISVHENIRVGLLGFEDHPHDVRDQFALMRTGRDFDSLDQPARMSLVEGLDQRFRLVHVVLDDDATQHLRWLESVVRTLALRDGCKLIVVDPWNELEHLPEPGESLTAYINFAVKFIRQLAERLDVHIALVAHPRKMPTDSDRPPTGYDIADSAAFFNKPSLGVTVHQRSSTNESGEKDEWVDLPVWKCRKTRLYGFNKGSVKVRYDEDHMSYSKYRRGGGHDE